MRCSLHGGEPATSACILLALTWGAGMGGRLAPSSRWHLQHGRVAEQASAGLASVWSFRLLAAKPAACAG